jgi:glucosyl-dolichyl phosphate glucuronosyltransferase
MSNSPSVSVLFATYKRGDILDKTLASLAALAPSAFTYEILVIDNAGEAATRQLVESYVGRMPVRYLVETAPGKNSALIHGFKASRGELLVFTDDDVIVDAEWLNKLYAGAGRHPEAALFGGRILPDYPKDYQRVATEIDFNHWFLRSAYVIADWEQGEGPIKIGHIWGPNMAVRRSVFDAGIHFNPKIGPNGKDYVMGSETEFLRRANQAGFEGVYLPEALVYHQIRAEQLNLQWIEGRAYRSGKGQAAAATLDCPKLWGVPRYLWKKYALTSIKSAIGFWYNRDQRFDNAIAHYMLKGQIDQHKKMSHE